MIPGCPITPAHIAAICQPRWIDSNFAARGGLRSVDSVSGGELVGRNGGGNYEGIAIPLGWPGEVYIREFLLRLDHPDFEQKSDGTSKPRGKYLCAPGRKNLMYIPADADPAWLFDTSIPVWITEGPLKALALWRAVHHNIDTPPALPVAINGVWGHRGTVGKDNDASGTRVDVKGLIPDFSKINLDGRRCVIIFDADIKQNSSVQAARRDLKRELQQLGAMIALFPWPKELPPGVNGIDDLLKACGPDEVLKLIAGARVQRPSKSVTAAVSGIPVAGTGTTELANAERLVNEHGANFRFVANKYIIYDGQRYVDDELGQIACLAKKTVRSIYREAADQEDPTARRTMADWAKRSEKFTQIMAMLKLAASEPGVAILPAQLDVDAMLLNVANGTIDLRTGALHPHRREDLITKLAPVNYDPDAKCPRWVQFLAEVFEPHPDIPAFLQVAAGYSLTADTREECLLILHGDGRNGKGTFIKVLMALLGDYAGTADFSTFIAMRDNRGPRDDIANMMGRRLITSQEGRDGAALAETIVKWLTGGDRVRARKLHENSYEFDPVCKIWLASNYKPTIKGQDPAIWSRIRLVPFDVCFEGREDRTLKVALMHELPGILNWMVEGCLRWQAEGLPVPESVREATSDYRTESDQVHRFIEDRCIVGPSALATGSALYRAYTSWAHDSGVSDVLSGTTLGERLSKLFTKRRTNAGAVYSGITVRSE
jgi:P4 family phage/plasmid primase-like protien